MSIVCVYNTGAVTALCCVGDTIIAGVSSHLSIYCILHTEHVQTLEVLPARVVHGIRPESDELPTRMCIFGQKCIQMVQADPLTLEIKIIGDLTELADWIWEVTWLKGEEQLCLSLGHNAIVTYDILSGSLLDSVYCQEMCILYSAKFLTRDPHCVILAAGTVFNQVLIWSRDSSRDCNGQVVPFHRLTGHQGVIFSVDYDAKSQRICSVSDDRSIRLYQLHFSEAATSPALSDWDTCSSSLLSVLYGHSARVWDVKLLQSVFISVGEDATCCVWNYDGHVIKRFKGHKGKSILSLAVGSREDFIVTGGGDNSIRMWKLWHDDDSQPKISTRTINLKVKSSDYPRNTLLMGFKHVVTMTNDGNLLMYSFLTQDVVCLMSDKMFLSYTVMSISPNHQCIALANKHGTLRVFHFADADHLDTTEMTITEKCVCDKKILSVIWLDSDTILTSVPNGINNIWILRHGNSLDLEMSCKFDFPVSNNCWVTAAILLQDGEYLICGDRTGSVFLYRLQPENQLNQGELVQTFAKLHGKGGVTDIGWFDGHVYTAGRDSRYRQFMWNQTGQLSLLNSKKVCKGLEWIEKLVFIEDDIFIQGFYTNLFILWSVKNNQKLLELQCGGGHRSWDYCSCGNAARFVFIKAREVKVTDIDMTSSQVIVKECLHGRELCDAKYVNSWADSLGNTTTLIATCSEDTYICLSRLYYRNGIPRLKVLHTLSGHISSVFCLSVCSSMLQTDSLHRKLIFSAGGRSQIKVWCVEIKSDYDSCDDKSEKNIQSTCNESCKNENHSCEKHCSNLLDNTILEREENILLTDSHWEHVPSTNCEPSHNINRECTYACCASKSTGDNSNKLHEDIDDAVVSSYKCLAELQLGKMVKQKKSWRQPLHNSDPETRILDLSITLLDQHDLCCESSLYFISTACSDGFVRLLAFNEGSRDLTLIAELAHTNCVLKSRNIIIASHGPDLKVTKYNKTSSVTQTRIVIISAATDGKVAFWDVTDMYQCFAADVLFKNGCHGKDNIGTAVVVEDSTKERHPFFSMTLHQSGINSLHIEELADGNYLMITGGDDNALAVNKLNIRLSDGHIDLEVISSGTCLSAHATQITGVWLLNPDVVLSVSIDQRLCIWKLDENQGIYKLMLLQCKFVMVSDVANVHVWMERFENLLI